MLRGLRELGVRRPRYLLAFAIALVLVVAFLLWRALRAPSVDELVDKLEAGQPLVERMQAMYLLGEKGRKGEAAVDQLITIMRTDPEVYIQDAAAITLGRIGDKRALPPLKERSAGRALRSKATEIGCAEEIHLA